MDLSQHMVIIGGGTAGWLSAALVSAHMPHAKITLIDTPDIPTIGVGEGTFPSTMRLLMNLGFSQGQIISTCNAGIKLGIRYRGFAAQDFWLTTEPVEEWARHGSEMTKTMAMDGRCPFLDGKYPYAMHFVASDLAAMLKAACLRNGVAHMAQRVIQSDVRDDICHSITIEDGTNITGDWFVDCSGFARLLIGQTSAEFVSYADQLLVDRAVVGITEYSDRHREFVPYTEVTARAAGWQFRIPTQTRLGNGMVYSSRHWSDQEAAEALRENAGVTDPRVIQMQLGYHDQLIVGNIAAVGLSGGFIEPMEATAIHIAEHTMHWFLEVITARATATEANAALQSKISYIKLLIMAHYAWCDRPEPFWRAASTAALASGELDRWQQSLVNGRYPTAADDLDPAYPWCQWNELLRGFGRDHWYPEVDLAGQLQITRQAASMPRHLNHCMALH